MGSETCVGEMELVSAAIVVVLGVSEMGVSVDENGSVFEAVVDCLESVVDCLAGSGVCTEVVSSFWLSTTFLFSSDSSEY